MHEIGTMRVKSGLAEMLKGGVIMDVVDAEQAKIAEEAGACAMMALERVPADIRRDGGVARMSDPDMIDGIKAAVTIPVMAKARIGHFVEAQVLQAIGVDYVDESEVLTPADWAHHIDKHAFAAPLRPGPARASRRRRTSPTPSGSRRSAAGSARPWWASLPTRSARVSCWPTAAGEGWRPCVARGRARAPRRTHRSKCHPRPGT